MIPRHRRTRQFTVEDYDLLLGVLDRAGQILLTPNTLTETSNLLAQHAEPERSRLLLALRSLIDQSSETVVPSKDASSHGRFLRLGLTDAVLLKAISPETPLITVDLELYNAALWGGREAAINFSHLRFAEA